VDINRDVRKFAATDVRVIIGSVKHIRKLFPSSSVDVLFMSNLLEHLNSKEDVFRLLNESFQVLKKGGRLLIMQPDISLVGHEYWDFFDHKVAITTASLVEVLRSIGYEISYLHSPFLPYTTKTKNLPLWPPLLTLYLKLPFLHRLFGKQFFVCAKKK
jgi:dolichol-phosphate mannosyltransferase